MALATTLNGQLGWVRQIAPKVVQRVNAVAAGEEPRRSKPTVKRCADPLAKAHGDLKVLAVRVAKAV